MMSLENARRIPGVRDWLHPTATLLYRLYDEAGGLLYVGVTVRRLSERFNAHARTHEWWTQVTGVTVARFSENHRALAAERTAIASEKPKYNKRSASRAAPEALANSNACSGDPFQTSRARADQGAGRGSGIRLLEMDLQDQVQTSPRRCAFGDWTWS